MAGGKKNASDKWERSLAERVTSPGVPKKTPKVASANRVFSVSGPKVPTGSGSGLSAAKGIRVIQGD